MYVKKHEKNIDTTLKSTDTMSLIYMFNVKFLHLLSKQDKGFQRHQFIP